MDLLLHRCWLPAGLWVESKTRVSHNKLCTERQGTVDADLTNLHLGKTIQFQIHQRCSHLKPKSHVKREIVL